MTRRFIRRTAPIALAMALAAAGARAQPSPTRGQLLYATHCVACHTSQVHWRDKKRATDWKSLKAQVRRWQAASGLSWSDRDIAEVARYLNDTMYHYPQTDDRVSSAGALR